jgi:hypothetical protein
MAAYEKWQTSTHWALWTSEGDSHRVVDGDLRLPYKSLSTIGTASLSDVKARWKFGQNHGTGDELHDETVPDNYATIPDGIPAESSSSGLNCVSKNGYAVVVFDSDLEYPKAATTMYVGCWIKSHVTSYDIGIGIIAAYYEQFTVADKVGYAIFIDTDNTIKAMVNTAGGTEIITPAGGSVTIDTDWHLVVLIIDTSGGAARLVVDNSDGADASVTPANLGGTGEQFTIGSSQRAGEQAWGFAGYIDELVVSECTATTYQDSIRHESTAFNSPVVDTGRTGSILSSLTIEYDSPNGSSVQFAFRASDTEFAQGDATPAWSGFTAPGQVLSGQESDVESLGAFVRGRYHQVRMRLNPSSVDSPISDSLQVSSPSISSLEINTALPNKLLSPSDASYFPGSILAQIVSFENTKKIDKISLSLTVNATDPKTFIEGAAGTVSFQAANFQSSRLAWVFQPIINWAASNSWESSGTTIKNSLQYEDYLEAEDAVVNAPYLQYSLFFPEGGVYDLWGYGYVPSGSLFWGLDGDTTDLRALVLGSDDSGLAETPYWTKFGSIYFEEGGLHTFTVYLGKNENVILDQWYFTTDIHLDEKLSDITAGYETPIPLSKGAFTTAVRLRSLTGGYFTDLESPAENDVSITAWLPSTDIIASGKFNYEIRNSIGIDQAPDFDSGLSIEYWQIGGGSDYFAAWNYYFTSSSVGSAYVSKDYGETFEEVSG